MVTYTSISAVIQRNADRGYVPPMAIHMSTPGGAERFPIIGRSAKDPLPPTKLVHDQMGTPKPSVVMVTPSIVPTVSIAPPTPPTVSIAPPTPPTVSIVPPTPPVTPLLRVEQSHVNRGPEPLKLAIDPICIGLALRDILYDGAPYASRLHIECEEGKRLESKLDELYKSEGGRSRGWTKTGLDLFIKPRCASGGDIKALDRTKKGFAWQLIREDKPLSTFLDFTCVAKQVRIAVWFTADKHVIVYPAADLYGHDAKDYPLYHVDSTGHAMKANSVRSCKDLVAFCKTSGITLLPPTSVIHSLSGLKIAELENVARGLGMEECEGTKVERIARITTFKLIQRLS